MARARNIKPGFYKNEDLAECSVFARLMFPGLWMLADREGRLEDRQKRIKAELFPFDSVEVGPLLDELDKYGLIKRYEQNGIRVIQVVNFSKHQTPHGRESDSELPDEHGFYTVHERSGNGLITGRHEKTTVKGVDYSGAVPVPKQDMNVAGTVPAPCLSSARTVPAPPDILNPDILIPDVNPPPPPPLPGGEPSDDSESDGFSRFWSAWPSNSRKVAKAQCLRKWQSFGLDPLAGEIVAHVEAMKLCREWREGFVSAPLVYLNQRRWEAGKPEDEAYSGAEQAVMSCYSETTEDRGWPFVATTPYSATRALAIRDFLTFSDKPDWVAKYFSWVAENLEARPGLGFDWLISRETFLRAKEENFSKLREAA